MGTVIKTVDGASNGFEGDSVFVMTDGSVYRQSQYYYRYKYHYRPKATVINDREIVLPGIDRVVKVERIR